MWLRHEDLGGIECVDAERSVSKPKQWLYQRDIKRVMSKALEENKGLMLTPYRLFIRCETGPAIRPRRRL
jgi:hypothetical protein